MPSDQWSVGIRITNSRCNVDLALPYTCTRCSIKASWAKALVQSGNVSIPDRTEELSSDRKELDSITTATDLAMHSSNDIPRYCSCDTLEQQNLLRSVRPRSLDVTDDIKFNVQGHQYENLQQIFRNPNRAASGGHLDVSEGRNKEGTEETGSQSSSSTSVSAAASTPVGRVTSSASVDTALGRNTSVCKCDDVDLISYRSVYNSVELDSVVKNPVGVSGISSEHCVHGNKGPRTISNQTAHCSRPTEEVSLLNRDLLKHCNRKPRSVSTPIDIVSAHRLLPDQRVDNSLALTVNTATPSPNQELQPICSGCSMLPEEETKIIRRRAYRVGLTLFNR